MAVFSLHRLPDFVEWIRDLRDDVVDAEIGFRLGRLQERGEWGQSKPLGNGVVELIIDIGPGYRVYTKRYKTKTILLLNAGTKATQRADVRRAKAIAKVWND